MPHTFREPGSIGVVGDTTYEVLSGPRHPENPGNVAMSSYVSPIVLFGPPIKLICTAQRVLSSKRPHSTFANIF